MESDISKPYSLLSKSTILPKTDFSISSKRSSSQSFHFSNAKKERLRFGAIFLAIIAASIKIVPVPHIGSNKSDFLSHPDIKIIPAAKTSFRGA